MRLACAALSPAGRPGRACVAYAYTSSFACPGRAWPSPLWSRLCRSTFWLCRGLRHDDAFITFVYARHLGAGEGFVFNLGERVLGATSPLHVLLLALVYRWLRVLPTAAIALGAAALSLQGLMLYSMARRFSPVLALLLGLLAWADWPAATPGWRSRPICSWPWFWHSPGAPTGPPCSAVSAWPDDPVPVRRCPADSVLLIESRLRGSDSQTRVAGVFRHCGAWL